jgi:hypothetical protein
MARLALWVCARESESLSIGATSTIRAYTLPTNFAHVHLGLGQFDAAFEWFDRVVEERDKNMMPILSYAHFDPIQDLQVSQRCGARCNWRFPRGCPPKPLLKSWRQGGAISLNAVWTAKRSAGHLGETIPVPPWVPSRPSVAST